MPLTQTNSLGLLRSAKSAQPEQYISSNPQLTDI